MSVLCQSLLSGLLGTCHNLDQRWSRSMSQRWWMWALCVNTSLSLVMKVVLIADPLFSLQSVFRAYDKDQSGYISIDEFQTISSNFPFIESFSVLDRDKLASSIYTLLVIVTWSCICLGMVWSVVMRWWTTSSVPTLPWGRASSTTSWSTHSLVPRTANTAREWSVT